MIPHPESPNNLSEPPAVLPEGLDPLDRHRIIAEHYFGWRPIGAVVRQIVGHSYLEREQAA